MLCIHKFRHCWLPPALHGWLWTLEYPPNQKSSLLDQYHGADKAAHCAHILHLNGYLCWDMKRRKEHGKRRHSRAQTSLLLAWKPVTKHCGKIQSRSWGEAASKSWHHLWSLWNSAPRQLNDILELITGFQMTMSSCPVCKAICIWVKCWFGKSGSPIFINACSKGKHPTAQGLPSRACFWEIGKQAMPSTNPRLSFFPCYLLFLWCAPSAPRATLLPPMPLSPGRAASTSQQQHFLKHRAIWRAICNPGAAQCREGPVALAALHSQAGVQHQESKSRIKPQFIIHLGAPYELSFSNHILDHQLSSDLQLELKTQNYLFLLPIPPYVSHLDDLKLFFFFFSI